MTPRARKAPSSPRSLRLVASGRLQLYVMAGVVACFLVTMVLAQAQSRSIDQNARLLTRKALPSLQHLAEANVALRHYAFDALHYALEPPSQRAKVADDMRASRRELADALTAYRALGNIPAERAVAAGLDGQVTALDQATASLQRASDDGQALPASELLELRERANAVGFTLARLIGLGSQHGETLAEAITTARRRSLVAELTLGGLSVALALLATLFTVALTRQFSIFFEARNAELERRADELERFSSRVAHDVLGPLGTVGLALQLAGKRDVLDERARPILTRGLASLGRVQRLVDGLLDFALAGARPAADARASVPEGIAGVVDAVADDARKRSIEVRVEPLPSPCPDVACHDGVLASLLGNLVRNAIKYMDDTRLRRITLRVSAVDGKLRFEVEDSGPGVAPELVERIFEPYVRGPETGQPGLGLGLATVRRLAEAHGGAVGLLPAPRRGSCFWFELPVAEPRAAATPEAPGVHAPL